MMMLMMLMIVMMIVMMMYVDEEEDNDDDGITSSYVSYIIFTCQLSYTSYDDGISLHSHYLQQYP